MSEISQRYRALAAEFTRRVDAVPDTAWEDQSPCEEWTVRDLVRHLQELHQNIPAWGGVTVELKESTDDDPRRAWAEARDAVQDLLDDPARAQTEYDGYFGRTSVEQSIDRFLGLDLLVHGWDIARATGQDEQLPAHEVSRVHAEVLQLGDNLRQSGICGPAVPVPEDAPEQHKLLGHMGRDPR